MSTQKTVQTQITARPAITPVAVGLLQRQCTCGNHTAAGGECEACRKKHEGTLQRAAVNTAPVNEVPPIVHEVLRSPGQPLDAGTRAFMEPRFGHDFSQVRVHTDAKAGESARAVNALAYTVGRDVVFDTGRFASGTNDGRRLLAHELTHVIQQRKGASRSISTHLHIDTSGELEATQISDRVMSGQSVGHVSSGHGRSVQHQVALPEPLPLPSPGTGPTFDPVPPSIPRSKPVPNEKPDPEDLRHRNCGSAALPETLVTFAPGPFGQGGRVKASPLTLCPGNTRGSKPQKRFYKEQFECINKHPDQKGKWVRGHLLHGKTERSGDRNLHGPGDTAANLIIMTQNLNQEMQYWIEYAVLNLVYGPLPHVLWMDVIVDSYYPGLPFFADSISIEYGPFDTSTGTEGPRWNGKQFPNDSRPPHCPTRTWAEGTGLWFGPTLGTSGFQSALSLRKALESRNFVVPQGGLIVAIDAKLVPGEQCRVEDYYVDLYKVAWGRDPRISRSEASVFYFQTRQVLQWRHLEAGEYYLKIWRKWEALAEHSECVLTGDITVDTFVAPPPTLEGIA